MVFVSCAECGKRMEMKSKQVIRSGRAVTCLDCYLARLVAYEFGLMSETTAIINKEKEQ